MDLVTLTLREYAAGIDPESGSVRALIQKDTAPRKSILRRCRTREQGIALIMVSHAIEYLVDSRLVKQQTATGAEREALAILLNANLSVYSEGTEIKPFTSRLRQWFHGGSISKREPANASV